MTVKPLLLRDITYLAKGTRGIASTAKLARRTVLIKERNPASAVDTIAHEAQMLAIVNKVGIGPKLIRAEPGRLIREFVKGEEIMDWTKHTRPAAIRTMLAELLDQCRELDRIGVNKTEMTRPYKHVLVYRHHPTQIDFDRSRRSPKPQNVTQLCQFMTSGRYAYLLRDCGVHLNASSLIDAARNYKKAYAQREYERIRSLVKSE